MADVRIRPGTGTGTGADFDLAIRQCVERAIATAKGFRGFKLHQGVESPDRFRLTIARGTLDGHTVDFRQSPAFARRRSIVGPFFSEPPHVEHLELVAESS